MIAKQIRTAVSAALFVGSTLLAVAQDRKQAAEASGTSAQSHTQEVAAATNDTNARPAAAAHSSAAARDAARISIRDARAMRIEGEKRFRENCGRCHMEPHKFPPRAMATIVRHMRIRAMLTEEDTKLILNYMTE